MTFTVLATRELPELPIEAEAVTPDRIAGRSERDVSSIRLQVGNASAELGELFHVRGAGSEDIRIEGDISRVKGIGAGMTVGRIAVEGSVGMHAGAAMRGGVLEVKGDAGSWAGAEMTGGTLKIEGNAGEHAGAAYPGSRRGMTGGVLLIGGSAGTELGARMRRGLIAVGGWAGDYAGLDMIAGSIVLCGGAGRRTGAGMKRGSVVAFRPLELLPTFHYACTYVPGFLPLLLRGLRNGFGFALDDRYLGGTYQRYSGDFTALGKGEILVWTSE